MSVNETVERIVYEGVDKISPASKSAADAQRALRQAIDGVKGALAAVGVTVGAGAMIALYLDTLKAVSALDDMKEATGASVAGLSALQQVAKVGGHDFEGLTGQIARMVKGLREGGDEGGRTAQAFAFLGIKARETDGRFRDTSEILVELAKKLQTVTERGDRVLLVQDALGKGAERYLPLLKDVAESTDLHATMTAKQVQQANEAEKSIRRVTVAMEESRREIVTQYAPAISKLAEELAFLIRQGGVGGAVGMGFRDLGRGSRNPGEQIGVLNDEIEQLKATAAAYEGRGDKGLAQQAKSTIASKESYKQYLQFLQRQDAMELATPEGLDARDLKLRQPTTGRSYSGGGFTSDEIKRRQQDVIEAAIRADHDRDKIQKALNPFYMTDEEKERAGSVWVKSIIDMKADVDAKIAKQVLQPTMDEDGLTPERDARLVALRTSLKTEAELEIEANEARVGQLSQFNEQELASLGGHQAVKEAMEAEHALRLYQIRQRNLGQLNALNATGWQAQAATVFGVMQQMTAGVAQHSRELFEINRIATLATIALKTPEAVASSYAFGAKFGGPVLGTIMAGIALAAMTAQAVAAASAKFGGGSAPSIAGTTAAPPVSPVETAAPAAAPQRSFDTRVIIVARGPLQRAVAEEIAEGLNELRKDGGFPALFSVEAEQ